MVELQQFESETLTKSSLDGLWIHTKSCNTYRVLAVSNTKASPDRVDEHPITVFYQDFGGDIWSKPFEKFIEKFSRKTAKAYLAANQTSNQAML
jgi:hypothetical protein